MSCREDVAEAECFFHSRSAVYVHERSVWFGLAGLLEPPPGEMDSMVRRLLAYGCNNRRGDGK